jgi:hypothetical protein
MVRIFTSKKRTTSQAAYEQCFTEQLLEEHAKKHELVAEVQNSTRSI